MRRDAVSIAADVARPRRRSFSRRGRVVAGIVHGMLEFGVAPQAVLAFVDAVCAEHDVPESRRLALVEHVTNAYNLDRGR